MKINVRDVYNGSNGYNDDEYSENPRKQYGKLKVVYKYNKKDKIWVTNYNNVVPITLLKVGCQIEMRTQRNGKNEVWPNLSIGSPFSFQFMFGAYNVTGVQNVTFNPIHDKALQPFQPRLFHLKIYDEIMWAPTITENVKPDPHVEIFGFNSYTVGDTSNLDDDCSIVFYVDYFPAIDMLDAYSDIYP